MTTANLIVWALIYILVFICLRVRKKLWRSIVLYASLLLIIMQTAPTVGILSGAYPGTEKKENTNYSLMDTGLYEFSKEKNVLVFVLDRLDYDYIESSLAQKPDLFNSLDGFIRYDNAISHYTRTLPALAHLLSGSTNLAFRTTPQDFLSRCWTDEGRSILEDIHKRDYTIELYAGIDYLFSKPGKDAQHVLNLSSGDNKLHPYNMFKRIVTLACYRFLPIAAKPYFLRDTTHYNSNIFLNNPYQIDDSKNGAGFVNIRAQREKNSFKFIHFNGSHAPYQLTVNGTYTDYPTSVEEQTIGCFKLLKTAFDRMKKLGIYEDAAIIITADHDTLSSHSAPVSKATRIGLFYKPAGSADTPLQISNAPVSTQNIPATILKAMGADYSAYAPALDDVSEDAISTRIYYSPSIPEDSSSPYCVYVYHIEGHAADFDNWKQTEFLEIPAEYSFH